jgi:hypothetical protein
MGAICPKLLTIMDWAGGLAVRRTNAASADIRDAEEIIRPEFDVH